MLSLIRKSLRFRLIALTLLVETVMLTLLIGNSLRLVDRQIDQQIHNQLQTLDQLFENSINVSLFEQDFATMESTLNAIVNGRSNANRILRVQVFDANGEEFLSVGQHEIDRSLVQQDARNIDFGQPYLQRDSPVTLAGIPIGRVQYILSLEEITRFRRELLLQAVTIAGIEILLSALLLFLLGLWLTRHLDTLREVTGKISEGHYDIDVQLDSEDELGQLAHSLKTLSRELGNREADLRQAHHDQLQLLELSQREHARLRSLLTSMNIGILYENMNKEVDYFNPAFLRIWTIDEHAIHTGMKTAEVLRHSSNVISHPDHFSRHILDVENAHETSESFEILTADGRTINQLSYPVVDEENRFIGRIWMYEDVTRQKQTAEQLLYLAERDHLTGLYNRRRFQDELERMLASFSREQRHFALLFFDLDEFKYINDSFGHRAGDSVLIRISGELTTLVRSDVFLSRLGGDEFGLLAPVKDSEEALKLAERVVQAIASLPFRFEGNNLRITASIGIALFPEHGNGVDELVAKADTAMYAAKQRGKNTSRLYEPEMQDSSRLTSHLTWNERIINALDNGRFVLHYQAVRNIQTNRIAHYELLIRMLDDEHPDRLIMPGNFIPVAEKSGKIMLIDQWVVRQAVQLLAEHPDIPALAVNISGRSLDEPTLAHDIANLIERHRIDPSRLIIELTETAAVSDIADAQRFIELMHRTGCRVYLDDFGAGFSTFSYLKHINADALKFDGQFIINLSNDHANQIFVKSMVTIARGLGKKTVAEFVEDADTLQLLKEFGVDMAQGYHVHKPSATRIRDDD
jgi:diguanylate cyclase (GGDEF)-like protein